MNGDMLEVGGTPILCLRFSQQGVGWLIIGTLLATINTPMITCGQETKGEPKQPEVNKDGWGRTVRSLLVGRGHISRQKPYLFFCKRYEELIGKWEETKGQWKFYMVKGQKDSGEY